MTPERRIIFNARLLLAVLAVGLAIGPSRPVAGDENDGRVGRRTLPRLGITFVTDDSPHVLVAAYAEHLGTMPEHVVVLVHGLDDPGWMWRDMIPALRAEGYVVARMHYPNDGPLPAAADHFAMSLLDLRQRGVTSIDVVAHSMGGLVVRDTLTREPYYAGDASGDGQFPHMVHFIMCGTPNHGSSLARLRAVSEIKEHVSRVFSGDGNWLGGLSDGDGEAATDLLPDSKFLAELNGRALATNVEYSIIAGRMSPITRDAASSLGSKIRSAARDAGAPAWLRDWLKKADESTAGFLDESVRGLGDGCVAIDSARLDGVDDVVIVEANHVGLIVNVLTTRKDPPAAIPLVVERLAR